MKEDNKKNKIFAKMLAKAFYDKKIDKFPFVLNSEQYQYLMEEWEKLKKSKL